MPVPAQHAGSMPSHIQIKHVPPELHQALRERAAAAGKTLSDFLTDELWAIVRYPGNDALFDVVARRQPIRGLAAGEAAAVVREARGD